MRITLIILMIFLAVSISGCTKLWNPYKENFRCEGRGNDGKCTTTMGAYTDSMGGNENDIDTREPVEKTKEKSKGWWPWSKKTEEIPQPPPTPGEVYDKNRYETMTNLVKEPKAPIVIPPTVVRVLIPPYTGNDNNMYGARFTYFFATEPKWQFTTGMEEGDE
jgi:conjugal transfer pilus assembly protein TraV